MPGTNRKTGSIYKSNFFRKIQSQWPKVNKSEQSLCKQADFYVNPRDVHVMRNLSSVNTDFVIVNSFRKMSQ